MNNPLFDLAIRALESGLFVLLGVALTTIANRRKVRAETDKARAEIKKLEEEAEKLNLENQNLKTEQMNFTLKQNTELLKAKEELKAKLYIANEEKLLLSKKLQIESVEKQKKIEELSESQKKIEEMLASQHKDIVEIKKQQTGQLPAQMPSRSEKKE